MSSPASSRIEAIENLARECHEHQTFQSLRWLPENLNDDENVRRALVRLLPNWGDGPMQLSVFIRALSIPGIRGEAVKALDSVAPVTGQRQARLFDELARLRTGVWGFLHVAGLPKLYGRDPLVLEFLNEWMRTGNQWQRALAASELCGLGETETAFRAVSDPEARVRKSLAVAIGYFNEQSGAEVLSRLLTDDDAAVSKAAQVSLLMLTKPGKEVPRSVETYGSSEWAALLKELSEFRFESNGFLAPDIFIPELYGTEAVDWLRVRHAEWAQAYRETYPHLGSCLQVSAARDGAVILLNHNGKANDGEWETYFFANWIPGARVHSSFGEFMRNELEQGCEWRNR